MSAAEQARRLMAWWRTLQADHGPRAVAAGRAVDTETALAVAPLNTPAEVEEFRRSLGTHHLADHGRRNRTMCGLPIEVRRPDGSLYARAECGKHPAWLAPCGRCCAGCSLVAADRVSDAE